jgi:excisionase family DNA binding protein
MSDKNKTAAVSDGDRLLLNIEEVSHLTGLSVGTLYHWISEKKIPVVRFSSRCVRFRRSDIETWIDERVQK